MRESTSRVLTLKLHLDSGSFKYSQRVLNVLAMKLGLRGISLSAAEKTTVTGSIGILNHSAQLTGMVLVCMRISQMDKCGPLEIKIRLPKYVIPSENRFRDISTCTERTTIRD